MDLRVGVTRRPELFAIASELLPGESVFFDVPDLLRDIAVVLQEWHSR
jgi:hypothetical protein